MQLPKCFRGFLVATAGNVAVIFALACVPMIGAVGAAVDYSRASSIKSALQAALDSTSLMLSKDVAAGNSATLNANAAKYFNALFTRGGATNVAISASYSTTGGSQVVVNGSLDMPTSFMGVLGFNQLTITGSSTTKWGNSRLRVALALDNTGSMFDAGKMTALKTATKNLLAQLQSAAVNNGDVYVSIIPFSKDVNVGWSNWSSLWIDWSDWDQDNGSDVKGTVCTTTVGKNGKVQKKCGNSTTWVPDAHNTWNGCITDRDRDYDQNVTTANPLDAALPPGQASTLYPAEQYDYCPVQMMGLTYDWTALNNLVNSMQPAGNTNQPIGLVWAWQSLVGGGPLIAPPMDPNYQYQQVIILLSDGLNTEDRWYQAQSPIDNRMYQNGSGTCANIKAAGITLYTIQVNTGGDPQSTLLQNCASDPGKFWMLTTSNDIVSIFNSIGTTLSKLRISK